MKFSHPAAIILFGAILALGTTGAAQAQSNDPAALALVRSFESRLNLEGLDITNTFTLVQKKPGEADRVLSIRVFRRDAANAFTLLFQFPESEKGKGYYRSGDDLFLYLPSTREFVYRNRKDDVGSSDVRTDTFGKSDLAAQYWIKLDGSAKVATWDTDVLKLEGKKLDVAFPIQKWYLRKTDGLPVKVESFSASGALLRTAYYIEYQKVGTDRFLFTKLLSVDALEKGRQTFLSIEGVSTSKIPDYTFSKAYLEEQSR